ncbi:MAG: class I adenylate-forming enzyme family protein [bacterium]|nr:class I adenylate-forming enzyme family protein [bacterium]
MKTEQITRKATVDQPWLKYYPVGMRDLPDLANTTLRRFWGKHCKSSSEAVVEYYGRMFSLDEIFEKADLTARALKALGVKQGDEITMLLRTVPEFIFILLAAEEIGAVILCRDGTSEENAAAVQTTHGTLVFAQDYLSKEEEDMFYAADPDLKHIILASPYTYADKSTMPDYLINGIQCRYSEETPNRPNTITWNEFLKLGEGYEGCIKAEEDPDRPLYATYTSGSTGPAKLLYHSAHTILGVIAPTVAMTPEFDIKLTSLLAILPPALTVIIGPTFTYWICTNKLVIFDPFCRMEDLDLEIMRYKPNCWTAIPQLMEVLVNSKRIPEDFKMDYMIQVGGGADPINNKRLKRIQEFLNAHGCKATYTMGYGMSEAAGIISFSVQGIGSEDCAYGIPLIGTLVGIFDKDTCEELGYGQYGEICRWGPGTMLGYQDPELTKEALIEHKDGRVWLHTGDFGYMSEEGIIYVLSRGVQQRYGGGYLLPIKMENTLVTIPGVKDGFFVMVHDQYHKDCYEPYLYLILEDGVTLEEVEEKIYEKLEPYEEPVNITVITERPYYHFKVNRIGLAREIEALRAKSGMALNKLRKTMGKEKFQMK